MPKELYFGPVRDVKFASNNASKKFKSNRKCYICQEKFDYQIEYKYQGKIPTKKNKRHVTYTNEYRTKIMTEDHIIPKVILKHCGLKSISKNTAPCCDKCNKEKGFNEITNYHRNVDFIFSNWK
jgi:5-methylcytosine-specific restriction endonuclease McrA